MTTVNTVTHTGQLCILSARTGKVQYIGGVYQNE